MQIIKIVKLGNVDLTFQIFPEKIIEERKIK